MCIKLILLLHFPFSINAFGQTILLHGIFEFLGIFIAFRYYLYLRKREGDNIEQTNRLLIISAAAVGAVLGSRILGSLEDLPAWLASRSFWLYFYGNKTLVGGLLGGLAGVELVKKILKERQNSGDLFTYPLLLGMIIGRIGCFSAGIYEETYGFPSKLPWAMNLGDGVNRHPVTLYEILFLILLRISLTRLKKHFVLQQGALFKIFLIAYVIFRFLLDFIKPGWRYFLGLGSIQLACIGALIWYSRYIVHPRLLIISKKKYAR